MRTRLGLIFICLFLSICLRLTAAQKCQLGQFRKDGKCEECQPGSYSDFDDGRKCTLCRPGTFNPFSGAPDLFVCRQCLQDTFSPDAGATECKPCPSGTISGIGATKCVKCGPGTRVDPRKGDKCEPCPKGLFSSKPLNHECEHCPGLLTGPRGSESIKKCKKCPPGRAGQFCDKCGPGKFQDRSIGGDGGCKKCPEGTMSEEGAVACRKCPANTVPVFKRRMGFFTRFCGACRNGTTAAPGSSICRRPGKRCKKGFLENNEGGCVKCSLGYVWNKSLKVCEKCPPESASLGGTQSKCVVCKGGLEAKEDNSICLCQNGLYYEDGKCLPCPPGTGGSRSGPDFPGKKYCFPCRPATFQDTPGRDDCKFCPFGTITEKEGSTSCQPCPRGTTPSFDGFYTDRMQCVTVKTGCPVGFTYETFWGSNCKRIK